ncbi:MAG: protein-L-isoaspartate(D-aspartate) O-methyltransferase [Lentisphaerae bacterium]|nr:protein-L-isoaspartate(D-aspartate) O-methyltransferase [Lentisphaerota bacterium]
MFDEEVSELMETMVARIVAYRMLDDRVLDAVSKVPRHLFIPNPDLDNLPLYYDDRPVSIGYGQTMSQPYIVAYMTALLAPKAGDRILEIGTGSGYQAAILAELGATVFGIERIPELAEHSRRVLASQGYTDVTVMHGDGYYGWQEYAPFDSIIAACAPDSVPEPLITQLKEGGKLVIPVGSGAQVLKVITKQTGSVDIKQDIRVRFVPMLHG